MKFYEIDEKITECVDLETGEIVDAEKLSALQLEREQKIENLVKWVKNLETELAGLKAEREAFITPLEKRIVSVGNKIDSLKGFLVHVLNGEKWSSENGVHKVSYRASKSVAIENEEVINKLDERFVLVKKSAKKAEIKKALEAGEVVPGCFIEEKVKAVIR